MKISKVRNLNQSFHSKIVVTIIFALCANLGCEPPKTEKEAIQNVKIFLNEDNAIIASSKNKKLAKMWTKLCNIYSDVPKDYEFEPGKQKGPFKTHGTSVLSCKYSPHGKYVASAGGGAIPGCDDSIRIWDSKTGKEVMKINGHVFGIYDLAFHQETGILASASEDYSVYLWNLEKKDVIYLRGWGLDNKKIVKGHVEFAKNKPLLAIGETAGQLHELARCLL